MKEILYRYSRLGTYQTDADTAFAADVQLKLVVEPHDFSLEIGNEVLRSTSCRGYTVTVSRDGEAVFYDAQNNEVGRTDKGAGTYEKVALVWQAESLTVQFGHTETVDHYPNCDGEYDRYSTTFVVERTVTLHVATKEITVK